MNQADTLSPWARQPLGLRTVEVEGLPFVATSVHELAGLISRSAAGGEGGWVVTPNVDILRRWHSDPDFRTLVGAATLFTPDGTPIVWASRLQGNPLPQRVTGSDLFVHLFVASARAGARLLLIGGNPGSAEAAGRRLCNEHGLAPDCVRSWCPPLGFEHDDAEMATMAALLREWRPQVVFVGLGSPKQEKLISALRPVVPQAWYLGVGVSFSFVAGDVRRAPRWVQQCGIEWLHRLVQEPGRLARRYLIDGLPFAVRLMARAVARSVR